MEVRRLLQQSDHRQNSQVDVILAVSGRFDLTPGCSEIRWIMHTIRMLSVFLAIALSVFLVSFAKAQPVVMPFRTGLCWNGQLYVLDNLVRLVRSVSDNEAELRLVNTETGQRLIALAVDHTTSTAICLSEESNNRSSQTLEIKSTRGLKRYPVPSSVSNTMHHPKLLADHGYIVMLNSSAYARFNNGTWELKDLIVPKDYPMWASHPKQFQLWGRFLVGLCQAGEWGSGLLALDTDNGKWTKLYEPAFSSIIQSIATDNDGVFILTDSKLMHWRNGEDLRVELSSKEFKNYQFSCIYSEDSGMLYLANVQGQIFSYARGVLKQVGQVSLPRASHDNERSRQSNVVLPQPALRWIMVEKTKVLLQSSDWVLLLVDLATNKTSEVKLGETEAIFE